MVERDASSMIQVGLDILNTAVSAATKTLQAFLGDVVGAEVGGNGAAEGDEVEWWQHVGFLSRPAKPEKGKRAAQSVILRQAGNDVCIASRDLRGLDLAGDLGYGETCIYAAGEDGTGQAKIKLCKDGTIAIYTKKGNVSTGAGMILGLDPVNDAIRITNAKGYGIIIDGDGVKLIAGSSGMLLGPDGSSLKSGGRMAVDGTTITLGNPLPTPMSAALKGISGTMSSPSTKVLIE